MPVLGFGETDERWYGNVVTSILLIAGIAVAWHRRRLFIGSAVVGGTAILIRWIAFWNPGHPWITRAEVATLAAVLVLSFILLMRIFRRRGSITYTTIQAAISIYLLFGVAWANAYLLVIQSNPHAFRSDDSLSSTSPTAWLYFSYVTLTTVGYGDITPLSDAARVLAIGEALTGQLYLAVLIARLIGMQLIASQEQSQEQSAQNFK
jgi:voltage-gated potassium channel Kch